MVWMYLKNIDQSQLSSAPDGEHSLVKDVHEDVERPLVDAGPADGETDLGHCCPQGLLGQL